MRAIYLAAVWLHVLAAMTWVGGMVVFVAAVMPYFRGRPFEARTEFMNWFGARFRIVAWWCFAILLVTGTFNLWVRGVRPADFLRAEWRATSFGHLAVIKLLLVLTAVAVSAAHERMMPRVLARWMGRALLLIGVAVVLVAVMLVRAQ